MDRDKKISTAGSPEFRDELQAMRRRKARKKRKRIIIAVWVFAIAAAIFLISLFVHLNRSYSSYAVITSESREDEEGAGYIPFKKGYIRYSGGGVEYTDKNGGKIWNISHSMSDPIYRSKENIIALADINGNKIEIFDETGMIGSIDTAYTLMNISLSSSKAVCAVLNGGSDSYINMYDISGEQIYSIKTSLEGEGQPVDIAVNDDGSRLALSCVKLSGASIKTELQFYDFGKSTEQSDKKLTAQFDSFDDDVIGELIYFKDGSCAAITQRYITSYTTASAPAQKKRTELEGLIKTVFYSDERIGIVYENDDVQNPEKLCIYNSDGSLISDVILPAGYDSYSFQEGKIILTGSAGFAIMDESGRFISAQESPIPLKAIISNGARNRYFLINERFIQRIKLN